MTRKTNFEKLNPSEQVAIETQLQKVKKEDLENSWKEMKAKETRDKGDAGLVLLMTLLLFILAIIIFLPQIQIESLENYIRTIGPNICGAENGTYVSVTFVPVTRTPRIICSNNVLRGGK